MSAVADVPADWPADFKRYLSAQGVRSPETLRKYVGQVATLIASGEDHLAWATAALAGAPAGTAGQVRAALRHWRAFLDLPAIAFPRGARPVRVARYPLGDDELAAYYRKVKHDTALPAAVRCVLALLPRTGLRISEACKLRARDEVRHQGTPGLNVGRGKGGHGRFIPLTAEAERVLDTYLKAHRGGLRGEDPIFPGIRSGAFLSADTVRDHVRRLRKGAVWSPHVLRHTFATRFYHAGGDLLALSEILGHTDLETTRRYVMGSARHKRAAMEDAELVPPKARNKGAKRPRRKRAVAKARK